MSGEGSESTRLTRSVQRVQPDVYDREYFLSNKCEGADEFQIGRGLSPLKTRQLEYLQPAPGMRVLDLGCGRGEVLLACAARGAKVAGIDYAQAAVDITLDTLSEVPGADIVQGDVANLPWPDAHFDAILSGDVIEHLVPEDAEGMLREAHRVLKPGGRLILHTAPNQLFLSVTWPICRWPLIWMGHRDTVNQLERWVEASHEYHVNEQTLHGLRRSLRAAGFARPRVWIDASIMRDGSHHTTTGLAGSPMIALGQKLAVLRAVRLFAGNDIWAISTR
jgi:2-polyprenyl-3-methyl-5-hydroxy-6-metoxy-1,4-benzoquinol methylase